MKKLVTLALAIAAVLPAAAELKNDVIDYAQTLNPTGPFASGATYKTFVSDYNPCFYFSRIDGYITSLTSGGEIKSVSYQLYNQDPGGMPNIFVSNEPMDTPEQILAGVNVGRLENDKVDIPAGYTYVALYMTEQFNGLDYSMNFASVTFTWGDAQVGVEGIEAENGVAEYYNLQGVRVENPENGMFIRVQNGKSTKVAIK